MEPAPRRQPEPTFRLADYLDLTPAELRQRAHAAGLEVAGDDDDYDPQRLVIELVRHEYGPRSTGIAEGILDVHAEGFGFLRHRRHHCRTGADDVYVSPSQIHRLRLRPGLHVQGAIRTPRSTERYFAMLRVECVEGVPLTEYWQGDTRSLPDRPAILPHRRLHLSAEPTWCRQAELLAPLSHGQRVLCRTNQPLQAARALAATLHATPDLHVLWLRTTALQPCRLEAELERFRGAVGLEFHTACETDPPPRLADLVALVHARALRLVERGTDVALVIEDTGRVVRTCAAAMSFSGRPVAGGFDEFAFRGTKRMLGAARQTEGGAALTTFAIACDTDEDAVITDELATSANAFLGLSGDGTGDPQLDPTVSFLRPEDDPRDAAARRADQALRRRLLGATPDAARREVDRALESR